VDLSQVPGTKSDVIIDTEALTVIGSGMMQAAAEHDYFQRLTGCHQVGGYLHLTDNQPGRLLDLARSIPGDVVRAEEMGDIARIAQSQVGSQVVLPAEIERRSSSLAGSALTNW
jgi:hypothetical protein